MTTPFTDRLFRAGPPDPQVEAYWDSILIAQSAGDAMPSPPGGLDLFAELYRPFVDPIGGQPFVAAQLGQSLDGHIATQNGASHYVTGPESLVHLHRLRALCDAVVVGRGTVEADDPRLTVRHVHGPDPLRVAIDPDGRLAATHAIFRDLGPGCLRFVRPDVPDLPGVPSVQIDETEGGAFCRRLIETLHRRGCGRILIEGGGDTVSRFMRAEVVDRLHLTVAPIIIGDGRRGLSYPPIDTLADAVRPASRATIVGRDVMFDLDLRRSADPP